MFEQASLDTSGPLKSPWALTFAFAGQALVLSAVVLASLVHTDFLPKSIFSVGLTAPVPPGPATPPHSQPRQLRPQPSSPHPFTAPPTIPRTILMTSQEPGPDLPQETGGAADAIIGGLPPTGAASFVIRDILAIRTPPPTHA